jgi:metallo-beta-lactamase family protein
MKLSFYGAARQVTGSMYLLELADDYRILIDCGTDMEREKLPDEVPSPALFPFEASSLNLVLLTHAHIDHSGNIPNLYREGYEGQVLCTAATMDLTELLLIDSAHLNQSKLKRAEGTGKRKKERMARILKRGDVYLEKEVTESIGNFVTLPFKQRFKFKDNGWITFIPAGHLLGAAHIILELIENGEKKSLCFSGDIGRKNYPLLQDPQPIPEVDYLLCETTYGNRQHTDTRTPEASLTDIIKRTCVDIPGRLIIPSFSVGRTQALLYTLNRLYTERGIKPIKVFSDSPLAYSSTKVYEKYTRLLNAEAQAYHKDTDNLFDFQNLQYIQSSKSSRLISNYAEPCIIISSSGMIQGGRVEEHVAANISNPYCTILMIGYAAEGTLGHKLLDNSIKALSIKGKERPVLAKIEKIDVFSGHGDCHDLMNFVKSQSPKKLKRIFLVHGEESGMEVFKDALAQEGYSQVEIPTKGESFEL